MKPYDPKDVNILRLLANGYEVLNPELSWREQADENAIMAKHLEDMGDSIGAVIYGLLSGWVAIAAGATVEEVQEYFFEKDELLRRAHSVNDADTFIHTVRHVVGEVVSEGSIEGGISKMRAILIDRLDYFEQTENMMSAILNVAEMKLAAGHTDESELEQLLLEAYELVEKADAINAASNPERAGAVRKMMDADVKHGHTTSAILKAYFEILVGSNVGIFPTALLEEADSLLGPFVKDNTPKPEQDVEEFMEAFHEVLRPGLDKIFKSIRKSEDEDEEED